MRLSREWIGAVVLILLAVLPAPAWAQGQVLVELVTDQRVSITAQHEWMQRLAQAGIANVRVRAKQPADAPSVQNVGTEQAPIYAVKGVITSDDVVQVPGRQFRLTQIHQFAQWLDALARQGPEDQRPKTTAFGLNVSQFQQAHADLAQLVGFSTEGMGRREVVERIARQLRLPLRMARHPFQAAEDKVTEELSGFSCGTALAYLLRPLGLCLVPKPAAGGVEYVVVEAAADLKPWPIGWDLEKPDRDVAPALYEFLNVNVQGVAVTEVLKAVSQRTNLPVLWDYNALAHHGIEPEKAFVNLPRSRTTYGLLLRKTLFQARLKSEVRVDEADKPFLWVTTLKPFP